MTSARKETHRSPGWLSSPPITARDVFSSSPCSETASPLIRSVFKSPYHTDPPSHFSSSSTSPTSTSGTPQRLHSSGGVIRTARYAAQTPRSRSAPSTLARPQMTPRREIIRSPLSRDDRGQRMPAFSPASGHMSLSSAGRPVVLESNDGGRIYIARQVYEATFLKRDPLGAIPLKLGYPYPMTSLNLLQVLLHTPRDLLESILAFHPLDDLLDLHDIIIDLDSIPSYRVILYAIADKAKDFPWEVMAFASNTGDIEMARWAIIGLAGGEGDKLVRGSWKRGDFEGVSHTWLIELLRLKDKYTTSVGTASGRNTPTTPTRSVDRSPFRSTSRSVFSPTSISGKSWKPSDTPLVQSQSPLRIREPCRPALSTPSRRVDRRMMVDWEAVARGFDPPIEDD